MGNCSCEVRFINENESTADQLRSRSPHSNHNPTITPRPKSKILESLIDPKKIEEKENEIKQQLNIKLPQLGNEIKLSDFESLIPENISTYIKINPLNYKKYYPKDFITYKSSPIKFKNENIFYGNWNENCLMEGYGIYYIKGANVITEGVWIKGNLIFGRIFLPTGDIYEGEIKKNIFNGKGKIIFSNGEKYTGDFLDGEISGTGIYNFPDKTKYSGNIKNGLFNGIGKMTWINGTEYNGNFCDSSLNGHGIMKNTTEKYEGLFEKNEFNGKGTYYFRDGDIYDGNFENGIKNGKGIYKRNDKVIFKGIFNNDLPNGQGIMTYNENKIKGYWRNGLFVGNPEIINGNLENFNDVDMNISPCKATIYPVSLPHLNVNDVNTSQFTAGKDISFL